MTDFEEYIRQSEPHKREKGYAWQTAIGLQAVDGLKTSNYLRETARQHIEGDITIEEVKQLVNSYYESKVARKDIEDRTEEADKVSARITELLSEQSFTFSPLEYISIHRRFFEGIYEHAGKIRDYNITKKEWVLNGETVLYAGADSIRETLDYDFAREKEYNYRHHDTMESVNHITQFISDLWQIHPFGEGNTRTTAVFTIKYLRTFGFNISNETFAHYSWYFRNALVRANYNNMPKGIFATTQYLEAFFRNLILNEQNELKNRYLHVSAESQSATDNDPKCNICTLNCTLEELALLNFIKEKPNATQKEIAVYIGKSERTVKTMTVKLSVQGILERKNGRRNGYWVIKNSKTNTKFPFMEEKKEQHKKSIRFFNDREVRAVWDEESNCWWFSATDIVRAINDEPDYTKAGNYWRWLKRKLKQEGIEPVSTTHSFKFEAPDGKMRIADVLDSEGVTLLAKHYPNNRANEFLDWFTYSDNTLDGQSRKKAYQLYESGLLKSLEPGSIQCLQQIHAYLFGGLYDFAGQIRTKNISKGGFTFANCMHFSATLQTIERMPENTFDEIMDKYVEMDVAHPFMEGNGRSTRIWLDLMLRRSLKRCVDWSQIDKNEYLSAMRESVSDSTHIKALVQPALTTKIDDREMFMKGIDYSYYYEQND